MMDTTRRSRSEPTDVQIPRRRGARGDSPTGSRPTSPPLGNHHVFGINLDIFGSVSHAARHVLSRRGTGRGVGVFTCNVDHLMLMREDRAFREAYEQADVVTIDGAPVALLSRWTGTQGACRVTGVDLTAELLARATEQALRVALVGGAPGTAEQAAEEIQNRYPTLPRVLAESPRMGFAVGDDEDDRLIGSLRAYEPSIVIVCLGAPRQELWIHRHRASLPDAVLVGAGSTIDYLSGHRKRAPAVVRRTGTEALYRLATEFPRLWRRYLVRDTRFLTLLLVAVIGHLTHHVGRTEAGGFRAHPEPSIVGQVASPAGIRTRSRCRACVVAGTVVTAPTPREPEPERGPS